MEIDAPLRISTLAKRKQNPVTYFVCNFRTSSYEPGWLSMYQESLVKNLSLK